MRNNRLKLTRGQRLVGLSILLLGVPLSVPMELARFMFQHAADACEAAYDWLGSPFMAAHRKWEQRCYDRNRARAVLAHKGEGR